MKGGLSGASLLGYFLHYFLLNPRVLDLASRAAVVYSQGPLLQEEWRQEPVRWALHLSASFRVLIVYLGGWCTQGVQRVSTTARRLVRKQPVKLVEAKLEEMSEPSQSSSWELPGHSVVVAPTDAEELDEHMVGALVEGSSDAVVFTTTSAPPHSFLHMLLDLRLGSVQEGGYRVMVGTGSTREVPLGTPDWELNQVCLPETEHCWAPPPMLVDQLKAECRQYAASIALARSQAKASGSPGEEVDRLPRVALRSPVRGTRAAWAAGGVPPGRAPLGLPLVGALGAPAGAGDPGLGFGATGSGQKMAEELAAVRSALENMKLQARTGQQASASRVKEKRKKDKGRNKDKDKVKRRKKRRKGSSSGSGSRTSPSSSTSNSSSSSRGSSRSRKKKYPKWQPRSEKKVKFNQDTQTRLEVLHFKRRKDLLAFARRGTRVDWVPTSCGRSAASSCARWLQTRRSCWTWTQWDGRLRCAT